MKDLGPTSRILGMDIERDRAGGVLRLSQSRYIKKVLQVFRMDQAHPVSTPLGAHFKLVAVEESDQSVGSKEKFSYSNAVGSIMYAMIGTRPDLAFAVGVLSRFMSWPDATHWAAVQWVMRYMVKTQDMGL